MAKIVETTPVVAVNIGDKIQKIFDMSVEHFADLLGDREALPIEGIGWANDYAQNEIEANGLWDKNINHVNAARNVLHDLISNASIAYPDRKINDGLLKIVALKIIFAQEQTYKDAKALGYDNGTIALHFGTNAETVRCQELYNSCVTMYTAGRKNGKK